MSLWPMSGWPSSLSNVSGIESGPVPTSHVPGPGRPPAVERHAPDVAALVAEPLEARPTLDVRGKALGDRRLRARREGDGRDQRDDGERTPAEARLVEHHDQDQRDSDQRGTNPVMSAGSTPEGKQPCAREHALGHAESCGGHDDGEQSQLMRDLGSESDLLTDAVAVARSPSPAVTMSRCTVRAASPLATTRFRTCGRTSWPRLLRDRRRENREDQELGELLNCSRSVAPAAWAMMTAANTAALTGPSTLV